MPLQNITIVGASGNIGRPILSALLAPPSVFTITALVRPASTATFPPSVRVLRVDLTSLPALTAALAGQDAVVSCFPSAHIAAQRVLIDAAAAAGVRRFLPSEFGHNPLSGVVREGTTLARFIVQGKAEVLAHLKEVAAANPGFGWTGLATSPFFDWGLDHGMWGVDFERGEARVVGSGEEKASTSSVGFVGQAVRRVLETERCRNEEVDVVEFEVSLNEVRGLVEEEGGVGLKVVRRETVEEVQRRGDEAMARGDVGGGFLDLLLAHAFEDGAGRQVKKTANLELGLVGRSPREVVREWVQAKKAV
ncbi:isoflavone reductase [Podospora conica]|nr:isoflavone reductase [Schizothecium conicum]